MKGRFWELVFIIFSICASASGDRPHLNTHRAAGVELDLLHAWCETKVKDPARSKVKPDHKTIAATEQSMPFVNAFLDS